MKDWTGNTKSIYGIIAASNHSETEREVNDYYATDPQAIDFLLSSGAELSHNLWECACGEGHLSKRLLERGYDVRSTDLVYRGFGVGGVDFLSVYAPFDGDIITNPPYKYAKEFVEHALDIITPGNNVFMFLKLQFLEGKGRKELYDRQELKTVYISRSRIKCAKNGKFEEISSSAVAYGWFQFQKGYIGDPVIKWIN